MAENKVFSTLAAISPIDGRYASVTAPLAPYFSEYALIKTRVEIELRYLVFLSKKNIIKSLPKNKVNKIQKVYSDFSLADATQVKKIESEIKHDVKSVEYFLRNTLGSDFSGILQWIHFGLTSNDVNDPAVRLMLKKALADIFIPELSFLSKSLRQLAAKYRALPMLARTHGQPAVPTTFGKEIAVFAERLDGEIAILKRSELYGKFGGAVGNWNSLKFAFPQINWVNLSSQFLKSLGLKHAHTTIQTAPAEDLVYIFQTFQRINSILLDFDQDMWRYISDAWLIQKKNIKDVGSSTMPQKVNPIEFENSEGNLVLANGIFETLSRKLPISRLQRDLSDSTVMRNLGVAFAHSLIAYKSCLRGIATISPNQEKILNDLNEDWSILSEAVQTFLRKEGLSDAYEKVAAKVRGVRLDKEGFLNLIESLPIPKSAKDRLRTLTPENYLGYAAKTLK